METKLDFQTDDSKRDTPTIWIKTNQHTRLEFIFDEDGQDLWFSVDDLEIDPRSEVIKGMFFAFGQDFICMADLISNARDFFHEALEEIESDERDQRAHEAYLASPELTGRVSKSVLALALFLGCACPANAESLQTEISATVNNGAFIAESGEIVGTDPVMVIWSDESTEYVF